MPQLIIIPYNHVYVSIIILLIIGLLNFYKILIPLILTTVKYHVKMKLRSLILNLLLSSAIGITSKMYDLYFYTVTQYLYTVELSILEGIYYIIGEQPVSAYISDILLNKILIRLT